MFRKVAIPLDGSAFSERVLAHIPRIGRPDQMELLLIRVLESQRYYAYVAPDAVHMLDTGGWRSEAELYLKRKANELREQGYRVSTFATEGDVALSLCSVADAQDADLIAMTTHGRSGLQRWLMGSVADRVVRHAALPVYLVRPGHETSDVGKLKRVLVPLDGSELAEVGLQMAKGLAGDPAPELWLVQAVEMPELWGEEFVSAETIASLPSIEEQESLASAYLQEIAEQLRTEGHWVYARVENGHPANVIQDLVTNEEIDLIVMSTHGRSGISRWVFGSVAEKVLRTVNAPLLLVRAGTKAANSLLMGNAEAEK
jgi:nucleotide-binding universal stress UspA family protein